MNYNQACCKLFAFGWIGMPNAFQVLTRSLQALCSSIIPGLCYWYVDDLMAVSSIATYISDSTRVDTSVQHLLGEGSIASKKSLCAWAMEFLVWIIDLDTRRITLCERNLHKLITPSFALIQCQSCPSPTSSASLRWPLGHPCSAGTCDPTLTKCTSSLGRTQTQMSRYPYQYKLNRTS